MLIKHCSSLSIEIRAEQLQPFRSTNLKSTRHSFGKSKACGWDEVTWAIFYNYNFQGLFLCVFLADFTHTHTHTYARIRTHIHTHIRKAMIFFINLLHLFLLNSCSSRGRYTLPCSSPVFFIWNLASLRAGNPQTDLAVYLDFRAMRDPSESTSECLGTNALIP